MAAAESADKTSAPAPKTVEQLEQELSALKAADAQKAEIRKRLDALKSETDPEKKAAKLAEVSDEMRKLNELQADVAKKTAEDLKRAFETMRSDPKALSKAVEIYKKEGANFSPEAKRDAVITILQLFVLPNGSRISLENGIKVFGPGGKADQEATGELGKLGESEVRFALGFLTMKENPKAGTPEQIAASIRKKAGVNPREDVEMQKQKIHSAANLTSAEKSWMLSYLSDRESVNLPAEDARLATAAAERAAVRQSNALNKLSNSTQVEWTAEDFKSPEKAIGKLIESGGPMLVVAGGLWLILSIFRMHTTGEHGSFFMKILAGVAGVGLAKAVGAWDFAYNAFNGTPGTAGARTGEAVSKAAKNGWDALKDWAGSAGAVWEKVKVYWGYRDYSFEYKGSAGTERKSLLEYPAGALYRKATDPLVPDLNKSLSPEKSGVQSPVNSGELKKLAVDLHGQAETRWKKENPGKDAAEFEKFFDKQTVESAIKYAHGSEKPGTGAKPEASPDAQNAETFKTKALKAAEGYKDGWFTLGSNGVKKAGLINAINASADAPALKAKVQKWNVNDQLSDADKASAKTVLETLASIS